MLTLSWTKTREPLPSDIPARVISGRHTRTRFASLQTPACTRPRFPPPRHLPLPALRVAFTLGHVLASALTSGDLRIVCARWQGWFTRRSYWRDKLHKQTNNYGDQMPPLEALATPRCRARWGLYWEVAMLVRQFFFFLFVITDN